MPNITVIRPADCNEMNAAYRICLTNPFTPTVICCSRGSVPLIRGTSIEMALNGAYVLFGRGTTNVDLILIGTGSEVGLCVSAAAILQDEGILTRVVSMPCQEIFLQKSEKYRLSILPGNVPTLSVEASVLNGWHRFSHAQIGMTRFGMSGPGTTLFENFGFTVKNVVNKGKLLCKYYQDKGVVPNIMDRPFFDIDDK
jgi:transketolase